MKKKKQTDKSPETTPPLPKRVSVASAGLVNGQWGIVLSDGSILDGVEEIIQAKPSYSDGYWITAKIFLPTKAKPVAELPPNAKNCS